MGIHRLQGGNQDTHAWVSMACSLPSSELIPPPTFYFKGSGQSHLQGHIRKVMDDEDQTANAVQIAGPREGQQQDG